MRNFRKFFGRDVADSLRRRIGSYEIRILRLDLLQAQKQTIEFRIRDGWLREHVIGVTMILNLGSQMLQFAQNLLGRCASRLAHAPGNDLSWA